MIFINFCTFFSFLRLFNTLFSSGDPSKINHKAILIFETECQNLKHHRCSISHRVGINLEVNKNEICKLCIRKKATQVKQPYNLPVWYDSLGQIHYELPEQLKNLRIGEQMMIQKLSLYVPIQYLRFGQLCCSGHVCAFPQDIHNICYILPRLPAQVTRV